jgi:Arc/MetJ family transcription regulator
MRLSKVEIEIDLTLVDEVMRRYRLRSSREAVNLALRSLLNADDAAAAEDEDENDPYGLAALHPHQHRDTG